MLETLCAIIRRTDIPQYVFVGEPNHFPAFAREVLLTLQVLLRY